jgi:DNA-binding transcriptional ArsR family regulator
LVCPHNLFPGENRPLNPRPRHPPIPNLTDPRLASALSHPTRVHILSVVNTRLASAKELAEELGEPVANIRHHIKTLIDLDCIELAEKKPRYGSRVGENFYRATKLQYVDDEAWELLDLKGKWDVVMPILRLVNKDLAESLIGGTFMDPDDNHVSRTPMIVDHPGWGETKAILADAVTRLLEVRENVAERTAADEDAETMAIKIEILHFRSPDWDKDL